MCRAGAWILGVAFRDARISHPGFPRYSEWRSSVSASSFPREYGTLTEETRKRFALLGQ